ncbi:MAG: hypothetical protein ACRD2R_04050, partial [Terriglobales bacterium]
MATPIFPPGGDPSGLKHAIVVSRNGGGVGTTTHINVSGDTTTVIQTVGSGPVHAGLLPGNSRTYVANRDSDSISQYTTFLGSAAPNTISLPAGSAPVFVHTTQTTNVYVANSGTNTVGVILVAGNLLT